MSESTERNWYEFNDPFPSNECPCGATQSDSTMLYCADCLDEKGEAMAAELDATRYIPS